MPWASVAPAARAAAFLATPESSTPTGSLDCSQTTPARMNTPAIAAASRTLVEAATRPAPSVTISRAWAGPPMQPTRSSPQAWFSRAVGDRPSGGDQALGQRDHRRAGGQAGRVEVADHLGEAARGHAEEDVVRAGQAGGHRLDAQLARELDLGQVGLVLAVGLEAGGLLGRAGLQRRAEAAAGEQDGDRGAEGARADDGRAALTGGQGQLGPRRHCANLPVERGGRYCVARWRISTSAVASSSDRRLDRGGRVRQSRSW